MPLEIWTQPDIILWSQLLIESYQQLLGNPLITSEGNSLLEAQRLFLAPFAVVSHGTENDPIFNYGNQKALELWEVSWDVLTKLPSRLSTETVHQSDREQMLQKVTTEGFVDNYEGIRISSSGKRFLIKKAVIWNLYQEGLYCGQAATFAEWHFLS